MSYTCKPPPIITQQTLVSPFHSFVHSFIPYYVAVSCVCVMPANSLHGPSSAIARSSLSKGGATFFEEGLRSCVESYVVFVRGATFQIEGLRFSRSVGTVTCVRGLAGTECTSTYYTYSTVRTGSRTGPLFVGDYELHSTSTVLHAIHIPTSASSWFHYLYKYSYLLYQYLFCVRFVSRP